MENLVTLFHSLAMQICQIPLHKLAYVRYVQLYTDSEWRMNNFQASNFTFFVCFCSNALLLHLDITTKPNILSRRYLNRERFRKAPKWAGLGLFMVRK